MSDASQQTTDNFDAAVQPPTLAVPPRFGPYTELTPHAHGGLGEVLRATDPDLHRTVAVKRLLDRRAEDAASQRRFLQEAEITARLEHPGVVPVYGLFHDGGRPCYAMRFVEGQTLAQAIAAYHAGLPNPLAFRRLVQSFLQVCQTVAYAHSRGVIHRDLKPSNVMLGRFGETLVVDWGLAKAVGRTDEVRAVSADATLQPISGSGSETELGAAIGTPAYMSPEQAAGRWDVVAQVSDVYGLGAVLYTLLAGRPPLEKGNWPEMQQKIQRGDFPRPGQVKPNVPPPLEAVCLRAMAVEPTARYASVAALATDVERWLADEPVTAYREPLLARVRRGAQRHRPLVTGVIVLLVTAVVGLATGAVLLDRARIEADNQRQAAVSAQRKAEAINQFLIDDLLKQADPVNNPVKDKLTVRELLDTAAAKLQSQTSLAEQPEVESELRAVVGHAYEYLGLYDKAEPHFRRGWELRTRLLRPDRADTLALRNRFVCAAINVRQGTETEALAQDAFDACIRWLGNAHPETAEAANNLGEVRMHKGQFPEAIKLRRRASEIANASLGRDAYKTLEYDNNLAVTLVLAGEPREGAALLQSLVDRRKKNPRDPEYATALANLGGTLVVLGRFPEAELILGQAVTLQTEITGPESGGTLAARNLLCSALEGQEQWAEAEKQYLAVLADRRRVQGGPSGYSIGVRRTLANLARLYAKQKRWPEAARYLAELYLSLHPDPAQTLKARTVAVAAALDGTAKPADAERLLQESWEAVKGFLAAGDWLEAELASRYGNALRRQEKYKEAETLLVEAANRVSKAVGVPAWGSDAARQRVVELYRAWNKPAEAVKWR